MRIYLERGLKALWEQVLWLPMSIFGNIVLSMISTPLIYEVNKAIYDNEGNLKGEYNSYMGWAIKKVKNKLFFSTIKLKDSMLLLVSEFSHLRKDSSSNVEETQHFSMCNIGGKRIPDIRLRPWACSVLLFTRRFISVKSMSNNVIALCFKQLCASKYLKDEFDMVYDTFLADIPDAPEELTTSKSVISKYLYDILLRKLFHSRAAENVNRYKDQITSRHAAKNNKCLLYTPNAADDLHCGCLDR